MITNWPFFINTFCYNILSRNVDDSWSFEKTWTGHCAMAQALPFDEHRRPFEKKIQKLLTLNILTLTLNRTHLIISENNTILHFARCTVGTLHF